MATSFPTGLDSYTRPNPTDPLDSPSHSGVHDDHYDAIEALEAKVGIDSSGVVTSLDYLLKNAASADPGHTHTSTSLPDVESLTTSLTAGSVVFSDGSNLAQDNANFFWNDTANELYLGGATAGAADIILDADGSAVFNEQGSAVDFRVEGDTISDLLLVDGTNDRIMVNGSTGSFTVNGGAVPSLFNIYGKDVVDHQNLVLQRSTDTGGRPARQLFLRSRGSVGAETAVVAGDILGRIRFAGHDGTDYAHAAIISVTADGTAAVGNDDMPGSMQFFTSPDGTQVPTEKFRIRHGSVIVNEQGLDHDFRIETTLDTNAVSVDGGTGLVSFNSSTNNNAVIFNSTAADLGNTNPFYFHHQPAGSVTASFTGPFVYIHTERDYDAGTFAPADNYDTLHVSRHTTVTNGAGTTSAGATIFANNVVAAGTADTTVVLELGQDANSTGTVIQAQQEGNGISIDLDHRATTADGVNMLADAITTANAVDISADALTAGRGMNVTSTSTALTSGRVYSGDYTASGDLADYSGQVMRMEVSRTHTAANAVTDIGNAAYFKKTKVINNAGGTFNDSGDVLALENSVTVTAGTMNDTSDVLSTLQSGSSTGRSIHVDHNPATSIAIQVDASNTTADVFQINADSVTTANVFDVTADALTTGTILNLVSDSADINVRTLVQITNDNIAADSARALSIQQDGDADAIEIDQNGNGVGIDIQTDATSASAIDIFADSMTTGDVIDVSADALTTGDALKLASTSNAATTGFRMIDSQALGSAITADLGGAEAVNLFKVQRTNTAAAARSDNYDVMSIERNTNNTNAGGSNTQVGSVLNLLNSVSQDAGTTTDSVDVLTIIQDSDSTGRSIFIDHNADSVALEIDSEATTANVISIDDPKNTTANIVDIANISDLTTGAALFVQSIGVDATARDLVEFRNDGNAAGTNVVLIKQDAANSALNIDHNADGISINIDSEATTADTINIDATPLTTGNAIDISSLNNLTTGRALNIYSGSNDASVRNLVNIYNDAGGDNTTVMYLRQDGDDNALTLDNNSGLSTALNIDSEATTVNTVAINADPTTTGNVIDISADGLTTGNAISILNDTAVELTTGAALNVLFDSVTPVTASYTNSLIDISIIRDHNDGTFAAADNFDVLSLSRETNFNGGGGTTSSAGSVLKLVDSVEASITATSIVLEVTSDAQSTGSTIDIEARSTGNGINLLYENGTANNALRVEALALTTGNGIQVEVDSDIMTTGKAVKVLGDTTGAVEVFSVTDLGLTYAKGGVRTKYAEDNVSDPPTDAELDTAFGTPASLGSAFVGILDDASADTDVYICFTNDTSWFYIKGSKAV